MKRCAALLGAILAATVQIPAAATAQTPAAPPAPDNSPAAPAPAGAPQQGRPVSEVPLESWRFNPRERTARGLAAWKKEDPAAAVPALDSAHRLRPDDPLAGFNAGTAHLAAGLPDAEALLEQAATEAPPALAADGYYNLGNARLGAQNAAGALEAYKESLRHEPSHAGAKRNLELALRLLEEQKKQQEQQQNQDKSGDGKDGEQGEGQQDKKPGDEGEPQEGDPSKSDSESAAGEPQPGKSESGQNPAEAGPDNSGQSPLPQFQDQPDMTAEQAAAILQAVDNIERERRRDEAKARAKLKATVEKDW